MNKTFFDLVDQKVPRHNPRVVEGYAVQVMKHVEGYVDRIIRSVASSFPPEVRYQGYERCSPYEEDKILTERMVKQQLNNNRGTFELSRIDMYLVRYYFTFHPPGQPAEELDPVYLYLPIVGDAGSIIIHGSKFCISPILKDRGISVIPDGLFISLARVKLNFKTELHHFYANGHRESCHVVYSKIYQGKPPRSVKFQVQCQTVLALYLFTQFGVKGAFDIFARANVIVGNELEINTDTYPENKWVICTSSFANPDSIAKPKGVKDRQYTPSTIRIAVLKSQYSQSVVNLIAGFFYIADHFPGRLIPDYVEDQRLWLVILGTILFSDSKTEGKIVEEMTAHMKALGEYLDAETRLQMEQAGIEVGSIFELLHMLIDTYNEKLTQSEGDFASLYNKQLTIMSYVMSGVSEGFTRLMFKLSSVRKKPLNKKDVNNQFKHHIRLTRVSKINQGHVEVTNVSVPGDNKYFTMTSQLALQTDANPNEGRQKKKKTIDDLAALLHTSLAYVGSYNTMNKSDPTGRRKLNPYVLTNDDTGMIVQNPALVDILDRTQSMIRRKT